MGSKDVFGFEDLFDMMEDVREGFASFLGEPVVPTGLLSDSFPPCDVRLNTKKDLELSFAVAGYRAEEMSLTYEREHVVLSLDPRISGTETDGYKTIRKGIKRAKSSIRVLAPSEFYDRGSIRSKLSNGILTVYVSAKKEEEVKTSSIKIET